MNNSPTAFKVVSEDDGEAPTENPSQMNRQRPIVEFAIENQMVVKRRADRQKNGKVSNDKTGSKADSETGPGKNKASKRKREGDDTVDTKNPKQMKSAKTEKGKGPCNKKIDDRKSADRDSTKVPSQKASKSLKDSEQKKPLLLGTSKLDFNTKASTSKAAGGEKKASKNAPKPAKIDLQLPAADVNKWISK